MMPATSDTGQDGIPVIVNRRHVILGEVSMPRHTLPLRSVHCLHFPGATRLTQRRRLPNRVDVPFESTPLTLEDRHPNMLAPPSLRDSPPDASGVFIRVVTVRPFASPCELPIEVDHLVEVVRPAGIVTLRRVGSLELFRMTLLCCCLPFRFDDCHHMPGLQVLGRVTEVLDDGDLGFLERASVEDAPPLFDVCFGDATIVDQ